MTYDVVIPEMYDNLLILNIVGTETGVIQEN